METTIKAKTGRLEIRTERRPDNRWGSKFRLVPKQGAPLDWTATFSPEGFVTEGMALSAAVLQGKLAADESANAKADGT